MSYDLGIDGDYENLFAWLDRQGARECGDSVAYLPYEYTDDLASALVADLEKVVVIRPKDRVYVIAHEGDTTSGQFVFGGRKSSPWEGYAIKESSDIDGATGPVDFKEGAD